MRILARRYRRRFGEIDLIGAIGDSVVFVEVKTRSGSGFGRPAEAVTPLKRRRLARVALAFLQERGWLTRPSRFDVVEVIVGSDEELTLRHIVDAFRLWPNG
jgi:putative endonuclease